MKQYAGKKGGELQALKCREWDEITAMLNALSAEWSPEWSLKERLEAWMGTHGSGMHCLKVAAPVRREEGMTDIPDDLAEAWSDFVNSTGYRTMFDNAAKATQFRPNLPTKNTHSPKFVAIICFASFCRGWYAQAAPARRED